AVCFGGGRRARSGLGSAGYTNPIKRPGPKQVNSTKSALNRALASSCSAPEAQRGPRGLCPAPYRTVTGAPFSTKRDTTTAVRFWPPELAVGTQGWRVPDAAEAPSRQTGEWRD